MAISGLILHAEFPLLLQYFPILNDDFEKILLYWEGDMREGSSHLMQIDKRLA
jgi:hypothetical protein